MLRLIGRLRVAEVVRAAEVRERPQVPGLAGEAVQVDQPLVDPVPEGVPDRSGAPVRDLADDQGWQRGQLRCGRCPVAGVRREAVLTRSLRSAVRPPRRSGTRPRGIPTRGRRRHTRCGPVARLLSRDCARTASGV